LILEASRRIVYECQLDRRRRRAPTIGRIHEPFRAFREPEFCEQLRLSNPDIDFW